MNEEYNNLDPLNGIQLTPEEKWRMRMHLEAHLASFPLPQGIGHFFVRHAFVFGGLAAALLVGSTTVLADRATPGDLLYPVKLAVNDRLAVVVAGDDDDKLDTELAQVDRAIREEEQAALASLGEEELSGTNDEGSDPEESRMDDSDEEEHGQEEEQDDDRDEEVGNEADDSLHSAKDDGFSDIDAELRAIDQELKGVESDEVPED